MTDPMEALRSSQLAATGTISLAWTSWAPSPNLSTPTLAPRHQYLYAKPACVDSIYFSNFPQGERVPLTRSVSPRSAIHHSLYPLISRSDPRGRWSFAQVSTHNRPRGRAAGWREIYNSNRSDKAFSGRRQSTWEWLEWVVWNGSLSYDILWKGSSDKPFVQLLTKTTW